MARPHLNLKPNYSIDFSFAIDKHITAIATLHLWCHNGLYRISLYENGKQYSSEEDIGKAVETTVINEKFKIEERLIYSMDEGQGTCIKILNKKIIVQELIISFY